MIIKTLIDRYGEEGAALAIGVSVMAINQVHDVESKIPDRYIELVKIYMDGETLITQLLIKYAALSSNWCTNQLNQSH